MGYVVKELTGSLFYCFLLCSCELFNIDECLDKDGHWDYEKKQCDFGVLLNSVQSWDKKKATSEGSLYNL